MDFDQCGQEISESFRTSESPTSLDGQVKQFSKCLSHVLDRNAPITQLKVSGFGRPRRQPWVTPHLKKLLQLRINLHRKLRRNPTDGPLLQQYRAARREGTLLNKKLKTEYCMKAFNTHKRNPRAQWQILNKLAGREKVKSLPKATISDLTATFATVVCDPARPSELVLPSPPVDIPTLDEFTPVTVEYVEDVLKSLNSHKAQGSDEIPPCLLKGCRTDIAGPLTAIINKSLHTGQVPSSFKHAHVCPLYKAGDATIGSNYRPVSLLPVISKVLEKVVHRQLVAFFDNHPGLGALPEEQFAYRRNHSCEDLLAYAINDWQLALDKKQLCGAMFVDMSKAFDRVQHSKLVQELASIGVGGVALRWFADYLTGRTQQVVVGDARGSTEPCSRGVPQGSVLGPLLFCIYIRRTPQKFQHCRALLFADDIAFYVIGRKASTVLRMLQTDLLNLEDFLSERGLVLNPKKSQLLLLRRPTAQLDVIPSITCKGTVIPESSHVLYLGLLLDSSLSFEQQVERVCAKAQCKVASFRHGHRDVSMTGRRMFYLTIVQSTLDYASTCYVHCLSAKLRDKLESTSNRCLRRVFGHDQYTSIDFILTKYNLYTFSRRVNLKLFVFVFRYLSHCTSPLLSTIFTPRSASCRTNAATRGQASAALNLPRATSRYGLNAISFLAGDRWNMLPPGCRQAKPLSAFVTSTKSFLGFPVKRQRLLGVP